MTKKRRVILITDGDEVAIKTIEYVAQKIGGRCISASGGNPTPIDGPEFVQLILSTPYDPVLVMFDDNGNPETGVGEKAMKYVVDHPEIEVLGAVAVASNTPDNEGAPIDFSINKQGKLTEYQVNKDGDIVMGSRHIITGDTVDILRELQVPIIVGVGDIGKMDGRDSIERGAPITLKAVQFILERGSLDAESKTK